MMLLLAGFVAACNSPQAEPRSFFVFMEDGIAREGVLARCNQDRRGTSDDIECVNARRAAAAVALEQEKARREELHRESERKLLALRARTAREAEAQRSAEAAALAAAELAYERQWRDSPAASDAASAARAEQPAVFGAPVGPVMPSMSEVSLFDVYAESSAAPNRPVFEVAPVEPPASDVMVARPDLALEELATIPRPFRAEGAHVAVPQ